MIISRTPFRVSFFGGGTDYPVWYRENGGAVLGTTIDKYCYITCRYLPPFFKHRHRIVYSRIENVEDISEIAHSSVRETMKQLQIERGIEIHHDGDLPARTGLGSSSAFTVGLLNALYALKGSMVPKMQLAKEAIHIERNLLEENVGSQDQVLVAYGGFNRIEFDRDDSAIVTPATIKPERICELQSHLMLYFTGFVRTASDIAAAQIKETPNRKRQLKIMRQMVDVAVTILNSNGNINEFGKLLNDSWQLKRSLTSYISTPEVDEIYSAAIQAGASGGKLLGAGGGGFILIFCTPEKRPNVKKALSKLLHVPFKFEKQGSQIIFYEPELPYDDGNIIISTKQ